MSIRGMLTRLDRADPSPVSPDDCDGGVTGFRAFSRDRPGRARPAGEPDAARCPKCGGRHVAELVEDVVDRDAAGGLVWAGDGSPYRPEIESGRP